eukprot:m.158646 g.158646  ORF g.158646 m.158646 type:complete len:382 (+) comp31104_c0_seq1:130-1275(+)
MATELEAKRKAQKPEVSLGLALKLMQTHWGFNEDSFTRIRLLDSYDDCNFFVEADKQKFLLKCHNGAETDNQPLLDAQTKLITFLEQNGVRTNKVVPDAKTNAPTVNAMVKVHDGSERLCALRLLRWVDGDPMVGKATPELLYSSGELLARTHELFTKHKFYHEALLQYGSWDLMNTCDIQQFFKYVDDAQLRDTMESVLQQFKEQVLTVSTQLRKGAMHSDFNDANIILPTKEHASLGMIDFGDITYSWIVNDIAIATAYAICSSWGQENPYAAAAIMLCGFTSKFPLTELEKQLLPILTCCRMSTTIAMSSYSFSKQPDCDYILTHRQPAVNGLTAMTTPAMADDVARLFTHASSGKATVNELQVQGAAALEKYRCLTK